MLAEAQTQALQAQQAPTIDQIRRLQFALAEQPQVEIPPVHTFGPGFYCRTLHIPAGTVAVGKIHAKEHIFILTRGSMLVATEDGLQRIDAPHQSICRAGLKRAAYALTDVVGTNVHLTDCTELDGIEAELITPEPAMGLGLQASSLIEGESACG